MRRASKASEAGSEFSRRSSKRRWSKVRSSVSMNFKPIPAANVNAADSNGVTALMCAAAQGHLAVVRFLAGEKGAAVEASNTRARTPLMCAAAKGHLDVVRYLMEEREADYERADAQGMTALMEASFNCHNDVVQYLARPPELRAVMC
eukprot:TRINITY_DN2551_c0_g1_i2.p1 TRINITY_DN2551_c0_g1~~TRINITY_DN2551_c0_g1_i2.p1  ORF type:complete len:148 (-),score=29.18 TRINITY_DN2551_c0_g1_i2:187-630(-)